MPNELYLQIKSGSDPTIYSDTNPVTISFIYNPNSTDKFHIGETYNAEYFLDLFVREVFVFQNKYNETLNHRDIRRGLLESSRNVEIKNALTNLLSDEQLLSSLDLFVNDPLEFIRNYNIILDEILVKKALKS